MQDMGLISLVANYYKSVGKSQASARKIYSSSLNLALIHLGFTDIDQVPLPGFKGSVFENYIFNELARTYKQIYYWKRDRKELDFVCRNSDFALKMNAYEVKVKDTMGDNERQMYARYAGEIAKGLGKEAVVEFAPVLWNFDPGESALAKISGTY
jgi:predicted AAA+ superfamily ATPase